MSVWSISAIGIGVVFAVLWGLTLVLRLTGRIMAQHEPVKEIQEAAGKVLEEDTLLSDMAAIAAVMRRKGVSGNLRITRIK